MTHATPQILSLPSAAGASSSSQLPLCVDLDGTLLRTDLLHESALLLLKKNPLNALRLALWTLKGKVHLKSRLAAEVQPDYPTLPYRAELVGALRAEKERGRKLILTTASHRTLAEGVAEHLGLFDEVVATDETTNVCGNQKADKLVERFGEKGFAYIGDHPVDLPVWERSAEALVLGPPGLVRHAARRAPAVGVPDVRPNRVKTLLRAIRVHQWAKNILVFVPLFTAYRFDQAPSMLAALLAFVAFSLCASSVYLLNDLLDLEADRAHSTKKNRPLAAGHLAIRSGVTLMPLLLVAGLTIAAWQSWALLGVLGAYFALNLGYTFWLKQLPMVDVLCLAGLYTVRIFAGSAAADVRISPWLLAFSMFFFVSLALVKRCAELELKRARNEHKVKGRGYLTTDLEIVRPLGTASGYLAVLVLALYIHSEDVSALYRHPERLWLVTPLVLYWISRVWLLTHRGEMNSDPVLFAVKDKTSYVVGVIAVAIALWAR